MSKRRGERSTGRKLLVHLLLIVPTALSLLPFLWMLATSFKEPAELLGPMSFWPRKWTFENYGRLNAALRPLLHQLHRGGCTVALQLVTGALAAWLCLVQMPGRDILFGIILATMMVPSTVTLVPSYLILNKLGWLDTYAALIVPWGATPFSIFLFRQFFRTIPWDLRTRLHRRMFAVGRPVADRAAFVEAGCADSDDVRLDRQLERLFVALVMTDSEHMRSSRLRVFTQDAGTCYTLQMAAAFTIVPILIAYFLCSGSSWKASRTGLTE